VTTETKNMRATAKRRVQRTKRSAGRLLLSGIGFSAAYFFDAEHGRARRQQAWDVVDHVRKSRAANVGHGEPGVRTPAVDAARPPFQRSANGPRSAAR
jgi:hypothetical protein